DGAYPLHPDDTGLAGQQPDLEAGVPEAVHDLAGHLDDVGSAGMGHQQGTPGHLTPRSGPGVILARHHSGPVSSWGRHRGPASTAASTVPRSAGGASRRSQRKYSTLPGGPGSGPAAAPATPKPGRAAVAATASTASARSAGSRTTPPAPTRSRPTSNCGLTIGTRSPPGPVQAASAGRTRASGMNDRSATVSSTGPPMPSGVRVRTFVRSSTRTRGSVRSAQ